MTLFSHKLLAAGDIEMQALYAKALAADAKRFLLWRRKYPARTQQSLSDAFNAWWMLAGPVSFKTVDDAGTYKRAVLAHVQSLQEPVDG